MHDVKSFQQWYCAGIDRQCMIEASARLSMCAACVSSALAITCVTGEYVSTPLSHFLNERYLPGQTIAFSSIIAVMRNVLLPYPQALKLTLLCMACIGAQGFSCCRSIASRFSC